MAAERATSQPRETVTQLSEEEQLALAIQLSLAETQAEAEAGARAAAAAGQLPSQRGVGAIELGTANTVHAAAAASTAAAAPLPVPDPTAVTSAAAAQPHVTKAAANQGQDRVDEEEGEEEGSLVSRRVGLARKSPTSPTSPASPPPVHLPPAVAPLPPIAHPRLLSPQKPCTSLPPLPRAPGAAVAGGPFAAGQSPSIPSSPAAWQCTPSFGAQPSPLRTVTSGPSHPQSEDEVRVGRAGSTAGWDLCSPNPIYDMSLPTTASNSVVSDRPFLNPFAGAGLARDSGSSTPAAGGAHAAGACLGALGSASLYTVGSSTHTACDVPPPPFAPEGLAAHQAVPPTLSGSVAVAGPAGAAQAQVTAAGAVEEPAAAAPASGTMTPPPCPERAHSPSGLAPAGPQLQAGSEGNDPADACVSLVDGVPQQAHGLEKLQALDGPGPVAEGAEGVWEEPQVSAGTGCPEGGVNGQDAGGAAGREPAVLRRLAARLMAAGARDLGAVTLGSETSRRVVLGMVHWSPAAPGAAPAAAAGGLGAAGNAVPAVRHTGPLADSSRAVSHNVGAASHIVGAASSIVGAASSAQPVLYGASVPEGSGGHVAQELVGAGSVVVIAHPLPASAMVEQPDGSLAVMLSEGVLRQQAAEAAAAAAGRGRGGRRGRDASGGRRLNGQEGEEGEEAMLRAWHAAQDAAADAIDAAAYNDYDLDYDSALGGSVEGAAQPAPVHLPATFLAADDLRALGLVPGTTAGPAHVAVSAAGPSAQQAHAHSVSAAPGVLQASSGLGSLASGADPYTACDARVVRAIAHVDEGVVGRVAEADAHFRARMAVAHRQ